MSTRSTGSGSLAGRPNGAPSKVTGGLASGPQQGRHSKARCSWDLPFALPPRAQGPQPLADGASTWTSHRQEHSERVTCDRGQTAPRLWAEERAQERVGVKRLCLVFVPSPSYLFSSRRPKVPFPSLAMSPSRSEKQVAVPCSVPGLPHQISTPGC